MSDLAFIAELFRQLEKSVKECLSLRRERSRIVSEMKYRIKIMRVQRDFLASQGETVTLPDGMEQVERVADDCMKLKEPEKS